MSSGTKLVVAMVAFAVLIAAGRLAMKKVGDRFEPPPATKPSGAE